VNTGLREHCASILRIRANVYTLKFRLRCDGAMQALSAYRYKISTQWLHI